MAFGGILKKILASFVIPWGEYNATPPTLSDGDQAPLQLGPNGELSVSTASGSSVDAGEYNATTPTIADTGADQLQLDARGVQYVGAAVRHRRVLVLPITSGLGALSEGACDEVRVDQDDVLIFGQPPERAWMLSNSGFDTDTVWTKGANWTIGSGVATHASGATEALSQDTASNDDPIVDTETYVVVYTVSGRTAGTITPSIAGTNGTGQATNGTFVEAITGAGGGNQTVAFTPDTNFDGSIDNVYIFPANGPYAKSASHPDAFSHIVGASVTSDPDDLATPAVRVEAGWYRRKGAIELG